RGDVCGRAGRGRPCRLDPHRAAASLYTGARPLVPVAERSARSARGHRRHTAEPDGSAARLPLLAALRGSDPDLGAQCAGPQAPPHRRGGGMSSAELTPPGAPLLEMRDVDMEFALGGLIGDKLILRALSGVSIRLEAGKALALVGESGSGKS